MSESVAIFDPAPLKEVAAELGHTIRSRPKQLLGCRHLFSCDHNGVEIQAYCGMIVCMLILLSTGEKPNRAMVQMVGYELSEGLPVPREPGYGSKRSQDGEAQRTCRERLAGCLTRTSGDGAPAAPSLPTAA